MTVSRETGRVDVSRETFLRFESLIDLLESWNERINLIGPATRTQIWSRHVDDSLRLLPLIPATLKSAIDLGSGAGFPGLVVAIATNMQVTLIEADRRKAAFLAEAARITGATVSVCASRIEDRPCRPARLIMSRALAPLTKLLALAEPLLLPDGICLFHKGRNVKTELAVARKQWAMVAEPLTQAGSDSVILRVSQLAHA